MYADESKFAYYIMGFGHNSDLIFILRKVKSSYP